MSYSVVEYTLARLLTDEDYLNEFKNNPVAILVNLELTPAERTALLEMDLADLTIAAQSFRKKKSCHTN